jgi:hypothetical protein
MLAQQLIDTEGGIPPSSRVDLRRLSPMQEAGLKAALGRVETAIGILSEGRL